MMNRRQPCWGSLEHKCSNSQSPSVTGETRTARAWMPSLAIGPHLAPVPCPCPPWRREPRTAWQMPTTAHQPSNCFHSYPSAARSSSTTWPFSTPSSRHPPPPAQRSSINSRWHLHPPAVTLCSIIAILHRFEGKLLCLCSAQQIRNPVGSTLALFRPCRVRLLQPCRGCDSLTQFPQTSTLLSPRCCDGLLAMSLPSASTSWHLL